MRIAVIDDDDEVRDFITLTLEADGHHVVAGSDGEHAIELLKEEAPDLLIVDILMPNKDGLETILSLRKSGAELPVLAISAGGVLDRGYLLSTAKSFGADEVLPKPFEADTLRQKVRTLLSGPSNALAT